ncbi:MAG: transporter [Flavobacteriales bacterium]|nr:transporter [Flavobacteriales bacterium]
MMWSALHVLLAPVLVHLFLFAPRALKAQDFEPRQYANAPIGVSFLAAGPAFTRLGFPLDPAVPLTDPKLNTYGAVLGYARVIRIGGQSAKLSVIAPYMWLDGQALFNGEPVSRQVSGLTDTKVRLAANLFGAPALGLKEFMDYKQGLVIGASLTVTCPTGQYDRERLVNLGAHRWSFKGELGASQAVGKWILELSATAEVFTDNTDFFIGRTREQDPVYAGKGHVIRNFPKGMWASVDVTYYTGGATTIDDVFRNDLQQNWRTGATFSTPVSKHHAFRFNWSAGVYARTGNNFDMVALTWQYRWGAGL